MNEWHRLLQKRRLMGRLSADDTEYFRAAWHDEAARKLVAMRNASVQRAWREFCDALLRPLLR